MSQQTILDGAAFLYAKAAAHQLIEAELARATGKFPAWPNDPIHGASVVAEEAGELSRAALQAEYEKGDPREMRREAVQVAVVAIRFLIADIAKESIAHLQSPLAEGTKP